MAGVLTFYAGMIGALPGHLILLSVLLFFGGLFFAPRVVKGEVGLLLRYPLWVWRRIQKWIPPGTSFAKMMFVIFFLNATSLLANILSGLLGILPFIFAFLVGLHVGIIFVKETGRKNLVVVLLNPVAFLELPVTWISLALGMQLGLFQLQRFSLVHAFPVLQRGLTVYGSLILPLLLIAAFTEALLIQWSLGVAARRHDRETSNDSDS